MFTGIVTQRATVADVVPAPVGGGALRIVLAPERPMECLAVGDSVAIDGCCLTAVSIAPATVAFEAIPETLRKTTLGSLRVGDRVNLEGALRLGDALGGHLVQGHVDGVGAVVGVDRCGDDVRLRISLPDSLHGATIPKGSVTVDGVSLTVGESDDESFAVYLIPHTLAATGLGERRIGDLVNLEADVVGRYVEHHVRRVLSACDSPSRPETSR